MRCLACNDELTDQEATRKSDVLGDYYDMCDKCLSYIAEDLGLTDDLLWEDDDGAEWDED